MISFVDDKFLSGGALLPKAWKMVEIPFFVSLFLAVSEGGRKPGGREKTKQKTSGYLFVNNYCFQASPVISKKSMSLRWLKTVSNTYIWIGRYNHCLSFDATIMVSKSCPIIGEHVVIVFLTQ